MTLTVSHAKRIQRIWLAFDQALYTGQITRRFVGIDAGAAVRRERITREKVAVPPRFDE